MVTYGLVKPGARAAAVQLKSLDAICSYDRDFDRIADLRRVQPDAVVQLV